MHQLSILAWSKLGTCSHCMRVAFRSSVALSLLCLASYYLTDVRLVSLLLASAAIGTAALWLTHLFAFASRSLHAYRLRYDDESGGVRTQSAVLSRRDLMPVFAKSFAFAALATGVLLPITARAQEKVPLCVKQDCLKKPLRQCWDCCICQFNNCKGDHNKCLKTWNNCNGACK